MCREVVAASLINGSKRTNTVPRALETHYANEDTDDRRNVSQDAISYYISKHQVKCQDSPIVP